MVHFTYNNGYNTHSIPDTEHCVAIKGITSPNTEGTETCIEHKTLQQGDLLMPMVTEKDDHRMESHTDYIEDCPKPGG